MLGISGLLHTEGSIRHIYMASSGPAFSVENLEARADVIAVIKPTGSVNEHWNNATNTPWDAPKDSGVVPLIVTDQEVTVATGVRGPVAGDVVRLRTIGGTAAGVHLDFEGVDPLEEQTTYLVFAEWVDWPTQDGFEHVLAPIGESQGLFEQDGADFINSLGLRLNAASLNR
jgi:hypothetical protein